MGGAMVLAAEAMAAAAVLRGYVRTGGGRGGGATQGAQPRLSEGKSVDGTAEALLGSRAG
jgi:hypothetical protein